MRLIGHIGLVVLLAVICRAQVAPPLPVAAPLANGVPTNRVQRVEYDSPLGLSWAPSLSPGVVSYDVFEGTNGDRFAVVYSVSNTCLVVSNLVRGTRYYFAEAAFNGQGMMSALSPVTTFSGWALESFPVLGHSTDLVHWTNSCLAPGFYRLGMKTIKEACP